MARWSARSMPSKRTASETAFQIPTLTAAAAVRPDSSRRTAGTLCGIRSRAFRGRGLALITLSFEAYPGSGAQRPRRSSSRARRGDHRSGVIAGLCVLAALRGREHHLLGFRTRLPPSHGSRPPRRNFHRDGSTRGLYPRAGKVLPNHQLRPGRINSHRTLRCSSAPPQPAFYHRAVTAAFRGKRPWPGRTTGLGNWQGS